MTAARRAVPGWPPNAPLPFALVAAFTLGGTLLAVMTVVLVLAQI